MSKVRFNFLPDRANAPPSSSASTLRAVAGSSPKDRELRDLLHQRFRVVFSLIPFSLLCYGAVFYKQISTTSLLAIFALMLPMLIPLYLLWSRKDLPLSALRWFEWITIGYSFLALIIVTMARLNSIESISQAGAVLGVSGHPPGRLLLFTDGSLFTGFAPSVVCNPVIINSTMLMVSYTVLIPTTWRRSATVMILALVAAMALVLYVGYRHPAFRAVLGTALFYTCFVLTIFGVISLYGSHKLDTLRKEVLAAQQIGQYILKRQLGRGGMGEVYLAQHRMLRRPCAVKLIRTEKTGDASSLLRFEREVQAMAQLTHPNTVEIYDYGRTDEGMFYYAMEYLPGLTIEEIIRQHGPMHPSRVIHILRQVCGALAEAHGAGMIHRDIKPANMFLCERGGVLDVVKLLDFGLVQVGGELQPAHVKAIEADTAQRDLESAGASSDVKLTAVGHIVGTPAYLSPEQARGEAVDARSDIYSLGAVAYYLLCRRPPFVHETIAEMLAAHEKEVPKKPSELRAEIDADLSDIVMRCLEKNLDRRYQSVLDLESALNACASARSWDAAAATSWWQGRPSSAFSDDTAPANAPSLHGGSTPDLA